MESVTSDNQTAAGRRRKAGTPAEAKEGGISRSNPRSRAVNRSSRAAGFHAFAKDLLRDLNPRGPLERLAADHVVHSAWRLKAGLEKQVAREIGEKSDPDSDSGAPKGRSRANELDQASRSMREALESLDFLRARSQVIPSAPAFELEAETDIFPNEWPIVPSESFDEQPVEGDDPDDEVPNWRDRLVFDFDVSDISPVVKGTWITVSHVISMIVDGWNWADILRSHPELSEDDIRTCVAYEMDEVDSAL